MILTLLALFAAEPAFPLPPEPEQKLARDLLEELVEIDTTHDGSTTKAADAVAKHLRAAGWPAADVRVLGPEPKKGNLVARMRGTGKRKPLMLLGHLDVVAAKREDWTLDPFTLTEKDGHFYGRGTEDMKSLVALWTATLLRFKREGYRP